MKKSEQERYRPEEIVALNESYVAFLKNYDGLDKYVLFALWLIEGEESVDTLAKRLGVTRQTIYNVIKRNKKLYEKYIRPQQDV